MTKSTLKQAQERRQTAEHHLAAIRATTEAALMERQLSLLEGPQPVVVPYTEYPAFDNFGQWPGRERPYYWTNLDDRQEGRYRPIYETDQDLRMIRADARRLQAKFVIADSALETLTNYVVLGFDFKVQAKNKNAPCAELVAAVQCVLDKFLERTNFIDHMDREIFKQSRGDGECFPTVYPDDGCKEPEVRLELTQPDYILAPVEERKLNGWLRMGHKLNYWQHGVHTTFNPILKRDDVTRPHGYHAVFDRSGDQWDYLPSSRVEHIKRNVGLDGRRGVSDFYINLCELEEEAKLRRNTAVGAAILAAIVEIRQYPEGTPRRSVENAITDTATGSYDKLTQNGTRTVNQQNVSPGTVRHVPNGMTSTTGPLGQLRSPVYVEVDSFLLRIIGRRWQFPEYMISGDASNANYASSLVSESPFVRFCEANQYTYGEHFKNILWKALLLYHKLGRFGGISWHAICEAVDIVASYRSPASRDPLQQAQANQIMHDAKVLSTRSWQVDAGIDPDEEAVQLAKEPKEPPPPVQPSPFGLHPAFGGPQRESEDYSLAVRAMERLMEGGNGR